MRQKSPVHEVKTSSARRSRTHTRIRAVAASVATLALAAVGTTTAHAAPGDSAYAEGQWISGSLLDFIDVEDLVSLGGVSATNNGTQPEDDNSEGLNASVLGGLVAIDIGGGIQLPVNFVASELGVIDQYAFAGPDASALGASGLISDDGAIQELDDSVDPPTMATLNLSNLLGDQFTDAIAGLVLNVGAVSGAAQVDQGGVPVGDYQIAGADVTFESPLVGDITTALESALSTFEGTVDAAVGSSGLLSLATGEVTALVQAITLGLVQTDGQIAIDLDLSAIVDGLIGTPLTSSSGATVVDFSTGTISVDLQTLVGLNNLDPNTDILDEDTLALIAFEVGLIVDGLLSDIVQDVNTALGAATVTISLDAATPPYSQFLRCHWVP